MSSAERPCLPESYSQMPRRFWATYFENMRPPVPNLRLVGIVPLLNFMRRDTYSRCLQVDPIDCVQCHSCNDTFEVQMLQSTKSPNWARERLGGMVWDGK